MEGGKQGREGKQEGKQGKGRREREGGREGKGWERNEGGKKGKGGKEGKEREGLGEEDLKLNPKSIFKPNP